MKRRYFFVILIFVCIICGGTSAYLASNGLAAKDLFTPSVAMAEMSPTAPVEVRESKVHYDAGSIILSFVGDCTLGTNPSDNIAGNFNDYYNKYSADYFFKKVSSVFHKSDLSIANLEGVLAKADTAQGKEYKFRGLPRYAGILAAGGITAVNIANNHTRDYYDFGFAQTLGALSATGIDYFGDGYVFKKVIKGVPFAFVGYIGWQCSSAILHRDITALKAAGNTVIVSFHWGEESSYAPDTQQRNLAHAAIDSGALMVVGHHPHVLQPIEYYKDRLIAYSLGNFCFGGNMNPRDKNTAILQVKLTVADKHITDCKSYIIPCSQSSSDKTNNYQPTFLFGQKAEKVFSLVQS